MNKITLEMVEELKVRYEIDDKWRSAWMLLAKKKELGGRLQNKQERIERRAVMAENRINYLLIRYDDANKI